MTRGRVAERDPYVDLIRAVAIVVVVVGHWATTVVEWKSGAVDNVNTLEIIPATRLLTWVVQVMPLVFFIGGFANARSLVRSHHNALLYLRFRLARLLLPTVLFLAVWQLGGLLVETIDPASPGKTRAAETAALPLWFLGIYLVAVALAPSMWRLHRRFRWWVVGALAVGVAAVDVVSIGFDLEAYGGFNYAFVWLLAHQFGFFYEDGTLQRWGRSGAVWITGLGLGSLVVLTVWANYPVSLVGVPNAARSNAQPPSLAMLAGILWLIGLVMLLRPAARRALERGRFRRFVGVVRPVVLTAYLWHVSAIFLGAGLWRVIGLPDPEIGTWPWWALRPVWMAVLALPFAGLLFVFRWFEVHLPIGAPRGEPVRLAAAGLGVVALAVAVLGYGETGFIPFAPTIGEKILMFRFTPAQNIVHLVLGGLAFGGAYRRRMFAAGAVAAATGLVAIGLFYERTSLNGFGMNEASGIAHLVVGGAGFAALAATGVVRVVRRRRVRRTAREDPRGGQPAPRGIS